MSQVKKLQGGGTPVGSITIDGIKYEGTPETIANLSRYLAGYGEMSAPLAGLTAAIANGQDVVYSTVGNTITGMNGLWAGVGQNDDKKRNVGASTWRKRWQATFNTDAHQFRDALKLLSGFRNITADNTVPVTLTDIPGEEVWFNYDPSTKAYLKEGPDNLTINKRIKLIKDYLKNPREESDKIYRLGSEYNPDNLYTLYSTYATPKEFEDRLNDILKRAQSGADKLTPQDRALLQNLNIVEPATVRSEREDEAVVSGAQNSERAKWNANGLGHLWDRLGPIAHINDDGSLSLNEGENWNLSGINGNIFFNDDFYLLPEAATGEFDPYRTLTYLNGKLYSLDNPNLKKYLDAENGYNSKLRAGDWNGADALVQTRFTESARNNPIRIGNGDYSHFLSENPNYRFTNVTGLVDDVADMNASDQIIMYVDLNDNDFNGPYRQYKYKYALLDSRGRLKRHLTPEEIHKRDGGESRGDLITYKRVTGTGTDYDNDWYYEDIFDKNGNPSNYRLYYSIKDPSKVILHLPDYLPSGLFNLGTTKKDIVLPKDVAEVLLGNTAWQNIVVKDPSKNNDFIGYLSWLFDGPSFFVGSTRKLRDLGFSDEEIEKLKNAKQGSASDRQSYLIDPIMEKKGGVLKHQFGGIAGGTNSSLGVSEKRINETYHNPNNAATFGNVKENWTSADTADVVALVSDLTSLGLALSPDPWTDVASVATGMAGSTSRFIADTQRHTPGKGLNYLSNLGMDAVGLIPIIGGPLKASAFATKITKYIPTLLKAAAVYGIGDTVVNTAKKIAAGEDFTVRDINMIVNALTGITALKRSGGFGKTTKKTTYEPIEIQGKKGSGALDLSGKKFTFSEEELTPLLSKTPAEQTSELNKLLLNKIKAETGNNNITLEQALSAIDKTNFNVESLISNAVVGRNANIDFSGKKITLSSDEVKQLAGLDSSKQANALDDLIWKKVQQELGNPNISKDEALSLVDKTKFDKEVRNWNLFRKGFLKKDMEFDLGAKSKTQKENVSANGKWLHDWWYGVGEYSTPFGTYSRTAYNEGTTYGTRSRYKPVEVTRTVSRVYNPKVVKYKGKNITFTPEEVASIAGRKSNVRAILESKLPADKKGEWSDLYTAFLSEKNTTSLSTTMTGDVPRYFRRRLFDIRDDFQKGLRIGVGPLSRRTRGYVIKNYGQSNIARPSIILPLQLTERTREPMEGTVMMPLYEKQGGRIAKQQLPWSTLNNPGLNTFSTFDIDRLNKQVEDDYAKFKSDLESLGTTKLPGTDTTTNLFTGKSYKTVTGLDGKPTNLEWNTSTNKPVPPSTIKKDKDPEQGGENKKEFRFDPTVPMNIGRALYSMAKSDKQLKNFLNRPRFQMVGPYTNAPRYIRTGAGDAYREAAKKILLHKTAISDPIKDWAMQQQGLQKALNYEVQGGLEDSKEFGKYKLALDDYNNKVALRDTDISNTNRQLWWKHDIENVQAENANEGQKSKFWDSATYSIQDWLAKQMQIKNEIEAGKDYNVEVGRINTELNKKLADFNARYPTESLKKSSAAAAEMEQISTWLEMEKGYLPLKIKEHSLYTPFYAKRGGSIKYGSGKDSKVTYSRDPYPELLLQNAKNSDAFAKQLNDSIIKLILQTKPLYVS